MTEVLKGAEPFILQGGRHGVLLTHGFTGSPSEMRLLGNFLHHKGFTVLAPRLVGHGSSVQEMEHCLWQDWLQSVEDGYFLLRQLCDKVSIAGLSMGGILSLCLAARYDIADVIAMSAPVYIANKALKLLPPKAECYGKFVPKSRRRFDDEAAPYSISYRYTPAAAVHELLQAIEAAKVGLAQIKGRLLVIQSTNDHTVQAESADYIYEQAVAAAYREKMILNQSGHIVTLDREREKVFAGILHFLQAG